MSLTTPQTEALQNLLDALMQANASALGDTLGLPVSLSGQPLQESPSLSDVPELFEADEPLLVYFGFSFGDDGHLAFIAKTEQAKVVADYMMGGTGTPAEGPMTDLQLSSLGEAFNQMMNASLLALSGQFSSAVEVNSPTLEAFQQDELAMKAMAYTAEAVLSQQVSLTLNPAETGDTLDLILLFPESVAQTLLARYTGATAAAMSAEAIAEEVAGRVANTTSAASSGGIDLAAAMEAAGFVDMQAAPAATATAVATGPAPGPAAAGVAPPSVTMEAIAPRTGVTAQPVQFGSFDEQALIYGENNKNLSLIMDVRLNLTVELGRTKLKLKEVLELTRGSVVELHRVAGEPVDLLANGKLIARGEVVVIEDNFGLRITSIISPNERLKNL